MPIRYYGRPGNGRGYRNEIAQDRVGAGAIGGAVVRGIQVGWSFTAERRRAPEAQPTETQDEGLFI